MRLQTRRHFHFPEWHVALAETFEHHNSAPLRCVALFTDNDLVLAFPCRYMRLQVQGMDLKIIRLASDEKENLTARDITLAPSVLTETEFLSRFVAYFSNADPMWDVILFEGILEDSCAIKALRASPNLPHILAPGGAWGRIEFLSCDDRNQPFERLSKGFRQNLRTAHNKLKLKEVNFEVARTKDDLMRVLPEFLEVESSGWKGELGTSAAKMPLSVTFLNRVIHHLSPREECEIRMMRVGDRPIASLFGIVTDDVWYLNRTGYDEAYHQLSPGHLLIENLLRERSGFNTMTPYNAPPWFRSWKPDRELKVYDAWIFRPSHRGVELANRLMNLMRDARPALKWLA